MKNTSSIKKYLAQLALIIICFCGGIFSASAQPKDAYDYFYDAKNKVDKIYLTRTGTAIDSYAPIEVRRQNFEMTYNADFVKTLEEAIEYLKKAESLAQAEGLVALKNSKTEEASQLRNTERDANRYLALAYLEKAQFVSNKTEDFANVVTNINDYLSKDIYYGANRDWKKEGYLLSAELLALVAQGKINEALNIYRPWQKFIYPNINYAYIKKEIALPSMARAFDMTGNYNHTRAILLETVYDQIRTDGGKFIPANNAIAKETFNAHYRNLGNAYNLAEAGIVLSLPIARYAGALYMANATPPDSVKKYILNAPANIEKLKGQIVPLETKLFAARTALQSANAAENTKGWKIINDLLKEEPKNYAVLAIRGYANYLKGDYKAAELDLSAAINENTFIAYFNDAYKNRALVYRKLGKEDLAANDDKVAGGFNRMYGALGAP